ncbi:MAG: M1 family aminopeptidase [Planctomycetota bacterium]
MAFSERPRFALALIAGGLLACGCGLFRHRDLTTERFLEETERYAALRIERGAYRVSPEEGHLLVTAVLAIRNGGTTPIPAFKIYLSRATHSIRLQQDERPLSFTRWYNPRFQKILGIALDRPLGPGQELALTVEYVYAPSADEMGGDRRIGPDGCFVCDYLWVPRIQPGVERPFDIFPYSMEIIVERGEEGITDGILVAIEREGDRLRYQYRCDEPATPFFVSGRYQRVEVQHGETRLTAFVRDRFGRRGTDWGRRYLDFIKRSLDVYVQAFGSIELPYYRLINIASERANFGIRAGMLLADRNFEGVAPGPITLWITGHELAHAWWGDAVRSYGPGAGTLTEAMANYAAVLAFGEVFGESAGGELLRSYRAFYDSVATKDVALADQDGFQPLYYTSTYNRGALTIHMLESLIGRPTLHTILREFVSEHAGESVPLEAFLSHLKARSPVDIGPFATDFIMRDHLPDYSIVRVSSPDPASGTEVTVANTGDASFPVTLRVAGPQGQLLDEPITIAPGSTVVLHPPIAVQWVEIDPSRTLLQRDTRNDFWPEGPFRLEGGVSVGDTGPVSDAIVRLWAPGDLPGRIDLVAEDVTDAAGCFVLTNLLPGHYTITAVAPRAVPLARDLDLRGDDRRDLSLAPFLSASLLELSGGRPQLVPLQRVENRWLLPWFSEEEALVVLNEGRDDEMCVSLLPTPTNSALLRATPDSNLGVDTVPKWILVEPEVAPEMTLTARMGQRSLRRSLLRPQWYLEELLAP